MIKKYEMKDNWALMKKQISASERDEARLKNEIHKDAKKLNFVKNMKGLDRVADKIINKPGIRAVKLIV